MSEEAGQPSQERLRQARRLPEIMRGRLFFLLLFLLPALSGLGAWLLGRHLEHGANFPFAEGDRMEFWTVGAGENVSFEDILAGAADFKPAGRDGRVQAKSGEVLWMRVTLHNARSEPVAGVLRQANSYHNQVDFFHQEGAEWKCQWGGQAVGQSSSGLPGNEIAFTVMLRPQDSAVFYMSMDDPYGPDSELRWHDPASYARRVNVSAAVDGAYFGLVACLVFYNAFLYARAKQRDLIWYCAYLVAFGSWVLVSSNRTISLDWPMESAFRDAIFMALLFAAVGFVARLTRRALETARNAPAWDRRLAWTEGAAAAGAVAVFFLGDFLDDNHLFTAILMTTHLLGVVVLAAAWRMWRGGMETAGYFVLALAGMLGAFGQGIFVQIIGGDTMDWRNFTVKIGSIQEMLIFALAMAERVRGLDASRNAAQEHALAEARRRAVLQTSFNEELVREVEERTEELIRLNAEKDRIMRMLGHDLRSPLASLDAGLAKMDVSREAKPDAVLIGRLRGQARYLGELVQEILTRAGQGLSPQTFPIIDFDAVEFIRGGVALYLPRAEQKKQTLQLADRMPGPVRLKASIGLLRQAFLNLLDNAIKFTPEGKSIQAGARVEGEWLMVEVADKGPGLTPMDMAVLMGGGGTLSARPTAGEHSTELGLPFVNDIIRRHGGRLVVESIPGQGAVFGFALPLSSGRECVATAIAKA